jgi:DNA-binding transcriptional MocR family regulator
VAEDALVARAAALGVGIYPARPYYLHPPAETALVMGFTGLPERRIAEGMRQLARALRPLMR